MVNEGETSLGLTGVIAILTSPDFDPYGRTRLYAEWRGQIVMVKSMFHVELYADEATRWYAITRTGVPIRRA